MIHGLGSHVIGVCITKQDFTLALALFTSLLASYSLSSWQAISLRQTSSGNWQSTHSVCYGARSRGRRSSSLHTKLDATEKIPLIKKPQIHMFISLREHFLVSSSVYSSVCVGEGLSCHRFNACSFCHIMVVYIGVKWGRQP